MLRVDIRVQRGRFHLDACFCGLTTGVTALFGPSGAGKTTIINAIAGLLQPDEGKIVLGDHVLFDHQRGIVLSAARRHIGCVFQEAHLFPHMSVRDNLLYGWRRRKKSHASLGLEDVITLLDLRQLLTEWPSHLSGGEKQRVAIGRALLSHPRLLLFDEPLAALDLPHRADILPYLDYLCSELGLPMVYVSHSLDEVLHLADHLVLIENGRILTSGSPQTVLTHDSFCTVYGDIDFGTILDAEVIGENCGLTTVAVGDCLLRLPDITCPAGTRVTLHIRARDVLLSTIEPTHLSIINTVPGRIVSIQVTPSTYTSEARLHLDIKGTTLTAMISLYSLQQMQLAEGDSVFALIKHITVKRKAKRETSR